MTYDTSGIQQERRLIEVGQEAFSRSTERSQSERIKIGKNQTWKLKFNCEQCGKVKAGRRGEPNRFCSTNCHQDWTVNRWLKCSMCLAGIGIGSHLASKLLGFSGVSRAWKKRGIVSKKPKSGSWFLATKGIRSKEKSNQSRMIRVYHKSWISEIDQDNKSFPDWGILWIIEKNRAKSLIKSKQKYNSLTIDQKREIGRRQWIRKKNCPIARSKQREYRKNWNNRNRQKVLDSIRKSVKKRKITDPAFKVQCNLRNRLKDIMKSTRKGGSSGINNFTGCNTKQLAKHIESMFTKRMTWDNYGTYWHVDHVLPCSSFNHNDPKQVAQCWHYTNLRPLESKKNMQKSDKITEPQMNLLLCSIY